MNLLAESRFWYTRNSPKMAGSYWYRNAPNGEDEIVEVRLLNGNLMAPIDYVHLPVDEIEGEWAGPITFPVNSIRARGVTQPGTLTVVTPDPQSKLNPFENETGAFTAESQSAAARPFSVSKLLDELPGDEVQLVDLIHHYFPLESKLRLAELGRINQLEALTHTNRKEFTRLIELSEAAVPRRIVALLKLSQLRGDSIQTLKAELRMGPCGEHDEMEALLEERLAAEEQRLRTVPLCSQELNAILAGLELLNRTSVRQTDDIFQILSSGGCETPITTAKVNTLVSQINQFGLRFGRYQIDEGAAWEGESAPAG